ncbi:MAG: hypothetical protein ACON4F_02760 [Candidatus Puniceispirillaceae bacterium]
MDIFETITSLFSGERVSHTDTTILAVVVIVLFIGFRAVRKKMKKD